MQSTTQLTTQYAYHADYKLAAGKKGVVYMGTRKGKGFLALNLKDLQEKKEGSIYYGKILEPEIRGEEWSLTHNAAFWAGAIDNNREFRLVTPLSSYLNPSRNQDGNLTGVQLELYWLKQNGYTFEVMGPKVDGYDRDNWTRCKPPVNPIPIERRKISLDIGTIKGISVIRKIYQELYSNETLATPELKSSYLIDEYKGLSDFELAKEKIDTTLYFGLESTPAIKMRQEDLYKYGPNSEYYGQIFYPEVRGEESTRQKREAFFAGTIKSSREIYLLTPIADLYNPLEKLVELNDQQLELYWLYQNGYTFDVFFDDKETQSWITKCIPPEEVKVQASITTAPEIEQVSALLQQIYDQYIQAEIKAKEPIVGIPKNNRLKRDRGENDELAKEHLDKKVVLPANIYRMFADSANSTAILQPVSNNISNEIIITEVSNSQYSGMSNSQ